MVLHRVYQTTMKVLALLLAFSGVIVYANPVDELYNAQKFTGVVLERYIDNGTQFVQVEVSPETTSVLYGKPNVDARYHEVKEGMSFGDLPVKVNEVLETAKRQYNLTK